MVVFCYFFSDFVTSTASQHSQGSKYIYGICILAKQINTLIHICSKSSHHETRNQQKPKFHSTTAGSVSAVAMLAGTR